MASLQKHSFVSRFFILLGVGLFFGWLVGEIGYQLTREAVRNEPEVVNLIIPAGTAKRIAAGEMVTAGLPEDYIFLQGDTLQVQNNDTVSHQLGPVWVPPGSAASLFLAASNRYSYACSFQSNQYLGLDVRARTTAWSRLQGIVFIGLPTGVLLFLYSLAFSVRAEPDASEA